MALPTSSYNGSDAQITMACAPGPCVPPAVTFRQKVTKSKEKSHSYQKKVVEVEKEPTVRRKGDKDLTVKFKKGHWILKQSGDKIVL